MTWAGGWSAAAWGGAADHWLLAQPQERKEGCKGEGRSWCLQHNIARLCRCRSVGQAAG